MDSSKRRSRDWDERGERSSAQGSPIPQTTGLCGFTPAEDMKNINWGKKKNNFIAAIVEGGNEASFVLVSSFDIFHVYCE